MMQRLLSDYDRELPPMNGNIHLQASVMQLSIWHQMIGTDADRNSTYHWGRPQGRNWGGVFWVFEHPPKFQGKIRHKNRSTISH